MMARRCNATINCLDVFSSFGGLTGCDFCPTEDRQANTKRDDEDGHQQSVAEFVSRQLATELPGQSVFPVARKTWTVMESVYWKTVMT